MDAAKNWLLKEVLLYIKNKKCLVVIDLWFRQEFMLFNVGKPSDKKWSKCGTYSPWKQRSWTKTQTDFNLTDKFCFSELEFLNIIK
jgi:hypothetical protein